MMKRAAWFSVVMGLIAAVPAVAELRLPRMFSDHAVLQRDRPIHIWGWATPGRAVQITLHRQEAQGVVDPIGRWDIWLTPEAAGGPYTLGLKGQGDDGAKTLGDIMVGDVWFASGQSNMEMPLAGFGPGTPVKNGAVEIAAANNPRIRLLRVAHRSSDYPLDDIDDNWTLCTPETAAQFSAVGYFFAREIATREQVTVGVIDSTWGGTPADSWVSTDQFANDPALLPAFAARATFERQQAAKEAMLATEKREDEVARQAGRPAPQHDWHPQQESWRPAGLYNGMVAPFTGYAIRGFLWYQGETNSRIDRAPFYESLFKGLITDWRHHFAQGPLPFLYAQISSFNSPPENWGLIRDAQRRALDLRNTAMAVTTDVGNPDNVHPADKQTVGARLALAARALSYGEKVDHAPPLYRQVSAVSGGLRVWFDNGQGLTTRGAPLLGFEIAGEDHRFVPATATIEGDNVVVRGPVESPVYVRYNWSNVVPGNLYNQAGLPASTFTSEERIASHLAFP
jgi:sialate O-acetylesterase